MGNLSNKAKVTMPEFQKFLPNITHIAPLCAMIAN